MYTNLTSPYAWYHLNSAGGSITGSMLWWLLSPDGLAHAYAYSWFVRGSHNPGYLDSDFVSASYGVRPVISIKGDTQSFGDGSPENPYEIIYN